MKKDMIKRMEQKGYCRSFKETLIKTWEMAEKTGVPRVYYADVGSIVINGLHIHNGVGDGRFEISVAYSTDPDFEQAKKGYKSTDVFFYDEYITICLYDLLPESAFTCRFKDAKWADIMRNDTGDFLIAVHQ